MDSRRLRFELLFALGWIVFGALVLPALVYTVGVLSLGTYAGGGLVAFYANLYRDLFAGSLAALALVLGPYVILMLARVPLIRRRAASDASTEPEDEPPAPKVSGRVEPRIGS
ncbi:MAG: hypothetical protein ABW034_15790 [Steroidobacteraceae bacterium]